VLFWITIMFGMVMLSGAIVGKAWVEKDKPQKEHYVPLASLDGFALCRCCKHPIPQPRPVARVITEIQEYR
jgi:hypothetical protein